MTRFRVFLVSYLTSYALVTGIGLLLQLRPWEPDTTNWVREHSQIYIFDFLVLQIPGLSVLPALLFGSPFARNCLPDNSHPACNLDVEKLALA